MPINNPVGLLIDLTKYPAALESYLPAAAPRLSATLADIAGRLPALPNFPVEIPSPPAPPVAGAGQGGLRGLRFIRGAQVNRRPSAGPRAPAPSPAAQIKKLVFE